jgi:hypothetical protein
VVCGGDLDVSVSTLVKELANYAIKALFARPLESRVAVLVLQ